MVYLNQKEFNMSIARDQFLTEAMGRELIPNDSIFCYNQKTNQLETLSLSTWEGFGKLWEWAQKQEWWLVFVIKHTYAETKQEMTAPLTCIINPDRFANAVYECLKEHSI